MNPAVFLDRDGVLVADRGLAVCDADLEVLPGVPAALQRLHAAGWGLVVVTNQPVVARGQLSEAALVALHQRLARRLVDGGGPLVAHWYACPHHPQATLPAYRCDCTCRKPRPGLLLQAAADLDLDLAASWMVGDRPTDIAAGLRAGCRTILVESGCHREAPIQSADPARPDEQPHHRCPNLPAAVERILG